MRTRCLECRGWATHRGRCEEHYRTYESSRTRTSHAKRREAIARGNNAAARMRTAVNKAGEGQCARCRFVYLSSAIDIDHITPLAKGGEDVVSNVQALCRPCHKTKTREDFQASRPPF
jgi:5-methylcytosine-specific restriction protein A